MSGWKRNLWILFFSQFLVMGAMTMIIPFLPLYLQELGVTDERAVKVWSGLIFGANFFTAFFFSPFWGRLADRYGRKLMLIRSGFGMAIVITLTGFATGPWMLLLLRLLNGVVTGFIPASIALVATTTPKDKVNYALGLLQSGAVAGSIFGPFFGGLLAEAIGFRMIFYLTGSLVLLAGFVVLLFVKESFTPSSNSVEQSNALKDFKRVTVNKPIISIFIVGFFIQFAVLGINLLVPLYVQELTNGERVAFFAGVATSVMGVANMIASPQLGKLGDKMGSEVVLVFMLLAAGLFAIPQAFITELWQLIILRFALGLSLGGLLPSVNTLVKDLAPEGMESRTYSFSNSAIFLGNMLGPIVGGWLAGLIGLRAVFLWSGFILLGNALYVRMRILPRLKKHKINKATSLCKCDA